MGKNTAKQFSDFFARHYQMLKKSFRNDDNLHDSFITIYVYALNCDDVMLPLEHYFQLLQRAKRRHTNAELDHQFRFIIPDDLFWQIREQEMPEEETLEEKSLEANNLTLKRIKALRKKMPAESQKVFDLYIKGLNTKRIAIITGFKAKKVQNIIQHINFIIK